MQREETWVGDQPRRAYLQGTRMLDMYTLPEKNCQKYPYNWPLLTGRLTDERSGSEHAYVACSFYRNGRRKQWLPIGFRAQSSRPIPER